MSRQIGDRDLRLSGPAGEFRPTGDRARVNSARLTRTWFYPARTGEGLCPRRTPLGIAPHRPGDCVEMNPAAASSIAQRRDEPGPKDQLFRPEHKKKKSLAMKKKRKPP